MQELLRMNLSDSLNDVQKLWMADSRPVEELYDCEADPHNINNLAQDPAYMKIKLELRNLMDQHMLNIGDMGDIGEDQMVELFWPGGIQPETFIPKFIIDSPRDIERQADADTEIIPFPCTIKLQCPTQGASIAYTFEEGQDPSWRIYAGPIKLTTGKSTMRAKAIRIGYKESKEVKQVFLVE
jgi:hypothetical protein